MVKPKQINYSPCECKPNSKFNDKLTERCMSKKPPERKPKKKLNPANVFVMKGKAPLRRKKRKKPKK